MRSLLCCIAILSWAAVAQPVTPTVSTLSPPSATAGTGAFQITVVGANFQSNSYVAWNGIALTTTFSSSTQLSATVPASFIAVPAPVYVYVVNPGPVQSNFLPFTILAAPLSIVASALPPATTGQPYSATLTTTGGTPPFVWSASGALPPGLSFSAGGAVSGTPTASGSYALAITVTDSQNVIAAATLSLTVQPPPVQIVTASLPSAVAGKTYSQQLALSGGTPPFHWSAQGLPSGLALDPGSGALSGTPAVVGTFNISVQVVDSVQASASRSFTLTVSAPPLTITTIPPLFNGTVGIAYAQTFAASGGVPPYSWSIVSGSVPGLTLDSNSGTLQGTPQTTGTFTLTVKVSDSVGQQTSLPFTITVNPPSLTITTGSSLPNGSVAVPYSQRFSVAGGTPPYTWSLTGGSVPGLSFDSNQAILSGTPTSPGSFTFGIQVMDSKGVPGSRNFTLTVAPSALKITTANQLPDAILGSPFTFQMAAIGGTPPYTWAANGLPGGVTIDFSTGLLSGTVQSAGIISFTVTVIDSAHVTYSDLFRINVNPPALPATTLSGLPGSVDPLGQYPLTVTLDGTYPVDVSGTLILTSTPNDNGPADASIQFSSGGRSATFTIPAGSLSASPPGIQAGTVAGKITVTLSRVSVGGTDVTPNPSPTVSAQIAASAPVITKATFSRSGNTLTVRVLGYATSREVTQATFAFSATPGQSLQTSQLTIPVDALFSPWYSDPGNAPYGSQFVFTEPFTIQGDVNAVSVQTVTLTNRLGSTSAAVSQQ
jgi:hypothetical protein